VPDPVAPFHLIGFGGAVAGGLLVVCAVCGWVLTGLVLILLRRRAILDHPNERSSHSVPTPRGGGWGIVITVLPVWLAINHAEGVLAERWPFLLAAVVLIAISWLDDVRSVSVGVRFVIQASAVITGLSCLPEQTLVFQGLLPPLLDRTVTALGWLWFVNLFNFMDGIDGIAGAEAAAIGGGIMIVAGLGGLSCAIAWQAAAIIGAAFGFLIWNWQPARVFMGEVGSVPLGFLLGWLLLELAIRGPLVAAVLLPLYFITDATVTLVRRLWRGKKFWQAHREHYYQKGVQTGRSHAAVVVRITAINGILIVLAVFSLTDQSGIGYLLALLCGGGAVAGLLIRLSRPPG